MDRIKPLTRRSVLAAGALVAPALLLPQRSRGGVARPGTPVPYNAQAVHFDGTAWLTANGALTGVVDSPLGLMATWVKATDWFNRANGSDGYFFIGPDFNSQIGDNGVANNLPQLTLYNLSNSIHITSSPAFNTPSFSTSSWVCLMWAWNTNFSAGNKILQLYYGDTSVTTTNTDAGAAFSVNYAGTGWMAGGASDNDPSGPGPIGDQADFQMWLGGTADLSVEANRRLFINAAGKPVNPTVAAASLGAPTIRFSGPAASYATNLGTAGAFTLNNPVTNASTSPSD